MRSGEAHGANVQILQLINDGETIKLRVIVTGRKQNTVDSEHALMKNGNSRVEISAK